MRLYNLFLEKIVLPLGDRLVGSSYIFYLKKYRAMMWDSSEKLECQSRENLIRVLKNAQQKSDFYKDFVLEGDDPYHWLQSFPIIDKPTLNQNLDRLLTEDKEKLILLKSSGSSGVQSVVYMNKAEQSSLRALQTLWWEMAGYKIGDRIIQTGISPNRGFQKRIKDILFRTAYFNAFDLDEPQVLKYLSTVKNKKVVLIGYASSLNQFAEIAIKNNLSITLKTVISLGDKLFDHYRKNLENAFQCRVFDTYGSSEGFLIGFQYDLDYLYHFSPQVHVELLDDAGNEVPDGTMGHVVVTRLDGYAMPLIRYKLGDLAIRLPKEQYPNNRKLAFPVFQKIVGRNTDVIKTPHGKYLIVHFFTGIFEHVTQIKQYRVLQYTSDAIEIEIIKNPDFNEEVFANLKDTLKSKIKDDSLKINYTFVTEIPKTKSGKPEIVKSFVNHK